jgi:hypothetical protein
MPTELEWRSISSIEHDLFRKPVPTFRCADLRFGIMLYGNIVRNGFRTMLDLQMGRRVQIKATVRRITPRFS